jgi:hypothetical protein
LIVLWCLCACVSFINESLWKRAHTHTHTVIKRSASVFIQSFNFFSFILKIGTEPTDVFTQGSHSSTILYTVQVYQQNAHVKTRWEVFTVKCMQLANQAIKTTDCTMTKPDHNGNNSLLRNTSVATCFFYIINFEWQHLKFLASEMGMRDVNRIFTKMPNMLHFEFLNQKLFSILWDLEIFYKSLNTHREEKTLLQSLYAVIGGSLSVTSHMYCLLKWSSLCMVLYTPMIRTDYLVFQNQRRWDNNIQIQTHHLFHNANTSFISQMQTHHLFHNTNTSFISQHKCIIYFTRMHKISTDTIYTWNNRKHNNTDFICWSGNVYDMLWNIINWSLFKWWDESCTLLHRRDPKLAIM